VLLLSLWFMLSLAACPKHDDCALYNTCPGDLIKLAAKSAGTQAEVCQTCLKNSCKVEDRTCSKDVACHFSARCRLTTDTVDFQTCLVHLFEQRYSEGLEQSSPWEGDEENKFSVCLDTHCENECRNKEMRWSCSSKPPEDYLRVRVHVSIRRYPYLFVDKSVDAPEPTTKARVRVCHGEGRPDPTCPDDAWVIADIDGLAQLQVPTATSETLYFEVESCLRGPLEWGVCKAPPVYDESGFPPTLFFPGPLLPSGDQPVAIWVMNTQLVGVGNQLLAWGAGVLPHTSQSVLLPDSCLWEPISAPNVRVSIQERPDLPACKGLPDGRTCSGSDCVPCIWYAVGGGADRTVSLTKKQTDGSGAGVVGLAEGSYTVRVENVATGEIVGRRKIQLRDGMLTVARIWRRPLSELEPE
jgi:hypothetical protein